MIVLDKQWMLVLPNDAGVVYEIGSSAHDVWNKVIQKETMGTGRTAASLRKQGYRAKKVTFVMELTL